MTWLVADGSQNTTVSDNILAGVLNGVYDAQAVIVGVTTSPYLTPRALALCDAWAHRSNEVCPCGGTELMSRPSLPAVQHP